jgi:hypothetical protein
MTVQRFILIFVVCLLNQELQASCLPSPSYQETFTVLSCAEVNLNSLYTPPNWQGLASYQGVILDINTVSKARMPKRKTYNSTQANLPKQQRVFYYTTEKQPCASLSLATKLTGIMAAACCDGDPNAPCLLGFSEYIYDLTQ